MSDAEKLEADIKQTRQQLGETVEALSEKLDVKAHVKSSATDAKDKTVDTVSSNWVAIVAVVSLAVVATIIWRKRS